MTHLNKYDLQKPIYLAWHHHLFLRRLISKLHVLVSKNVSVRFVWYWERNIFSRQLNINCFEFPFEIRFQIKYSSLIVV